MGWIKMTQTNNNSIFKTAAELLAEEDPIIKRVWEHYAVNKNPTPIDSLDVRHFWKAVTEKAHELANKK